MKQLLLLLLITSIHVNLNAQQGRISGKLLDSLWPVYSMEFFVDTENRLYVPGDRTNDSLDWSKAKIIGNPIKIIQMMYFYYTLSNQENNKYREKSQDEYRRVEWLSEEVKVLEEFIHILNSNGPAEECDRIKFTKIQNILNKKYGFKQCNSKNCKNKCHYKK